MLKQKWLSCLSLLFLLLMTWALSATDRKDFERGFTSYYQVNYEETVLPGGTTQRLHYLPGGSVMVETIQQGTGAGAGSGNTTGTKILYYGYQDHLGSFTSLVRERNGSRAIIDYRSYDAWGRLRDNDDWTQPRTTALQITDRGYTGHEHLLTASYSVCEPRLLHDKNKRIKFPALKSDFEQGKRLNILVFKESTLSSHSWEQIVENNIYDKLYVLSLEELEAMDYTVVYDGK